MEEKDEHILLTAAQKEGLVQIEAAVLIDATGDANVIRMAGYDCEKSDTLQPATLINNIGGYQVETIDREKIEKAVLEAYTNERLNPQDFQGKNLYDLLFLNNASANFKFLYVLKSLIRLL